MPQDDGARFDPYTTAELDVLAVALLNPDEVHEARIHLTPAAFANHGYAALWVAVCDAVDLGIMRSDMSVPEWHAIVRIAAERSGIHIDLLHLAFTTVLDYGAEHLTHYPVVYYARALAALAVEREQRSLHRRLADNPLDREAREALDLVNAKVANTAVDLLQFAFTGDGFDALAAEPAIEAIVPGVLYPQQLSALLGAPMAGKSSLALHLATCCAAGETPWIGAPRIKPHRVLYISLDETVGVLLQRQLSLDRENPLRGDTHPWRDNLTLLGRHAKTPPGALDAIKLSDSGIERLRAILAAEQRAGKPFGGIVIDTLAASLPVGMEENDNAAMTHVLSKLQSICTALDCWILCLHHTGILDPDSPRAKDPVRAARGASAIGGTARAMALLMEGESAPHHRMLRCSTNVGVAPRDRVFAVSVADAPNEIRFWRAADVQPMHPAQFMHLNEAAITLTTLGQRMFPSAPVDARGRLNAHYRTVVMREVDRWVSAGWALLVAGPHRGRFVSRTDTAVPHWVTETWDPARHERMRQELVLPLDQRTGNDVPPTGEIIEGVDDDEVVEDVF